MKKTYKNAKMEIVKMESLTQMLAGSPSVQMKAENATGDGLGREDEDFDW